MKISIITPVYNRQRNLYLTYTALEKQDNKDFEWIIVDDGSSDDTLNIIDTIKKEASFKVISYNFGSHNGYRQNRCRNMGAKLSSPETKAYMFLDADVLLYPDTISKYIEALEKNDKRVIIGMYWWGKPIQFSKEDITNNWNKIINEDFPLIENAQPHGMQGKDIREESFNSTTPDELHFDEGHALAAFGGNLLVPKEIFKEVALYNSSYNNKDNNDEFCGYDQYYDAPVEDGDFGLNLRDLGIAISMHNEINGYHVWHPRNISEIQDKTRENLVYLDKKHKIDVVEETKKIHQREWKL